MKGYDHNQEDVFRAVGISEEREAELKGMFNDMRKLENMKKSEIFEVRYFRQKHGPARLNRARLYGKLWLYAQPSGGCRADRG